MAQPDDINATVENSSNEKEKPQSVPVFMPDNLKGGCYSNNAYIDFNHEQFNLDFLSVSRMSSAVVGRIITTPDYFKRFTMLCIQQLKKYEDAHGLINTKETQD